MKEIPNVAVLRRLSWHYISPEIAKAAGMTVAEMKQFCGGSYTPPPEQLEALYRRINKHMGSNQ
jgi:hypothetical protein